MSALRTRAVRDRGSAPSGVNKYCSANRTTFGAGPGRPKKKRRARDVSVKGIECAECRAEQEL